MPRLTLKTRRSGNRCAVGHQVMKKNYWDDETGWLNVVAIIQSASEAQKRQAFEFLKTYFGESTREKDVENR